MTNNVYADESDALEMARIRAAGNCIECGEHADVCACDPSPRCNGCGATRKTDCECGE